ncbi:MAG: hypothetical protein JST39_03260, partial [Bacteroidetes bacterium]|nr:hypothetical protein [Bacteroidota bacterium]
AENRQEPTIRQLGQLFVRKFFKVFLYNIVVSIILGILIVLPVIGLLMIPILGWLIIFFGGILAIAFLFVIVFTLNTIFVVEDAGLSTGVGRLFYLLSGRWWSSVGFAFVIFIIYLVVAGIIAIVSSLLGLIFSINFITPRFSPGSGGISVWVLLFGLRNIVQQVFCLLLFCGMAINYYSLTEEKDGTGIEEQIDSIGLVTDKYGGIEEQY